ncbi:hypothetical protein AX17_004292 [Amanita inopinata Kibby_2008]|nr:hypothetical protein AX17_004292 [Amanita inopinata Kibby_2008]
MAPRSSQNSQKTEKQPKSRPKTVKLSSSSTNGPAKKYDPLTGFSMTPNSTNDNVRMKSSTHQASQGSFKGKGKAREETVKFSPDLEERSDGRLWVDIYEPTTEADLAVHVRKVEDVRRWFLEAFNGGPSGKLKRYRRILVLTGPAGTAKTTTVRVLGRELGFDILEWRSGTGDNFRVYDSDHSHYDPYETLMVKFETFFNRASNCQSLLTTSSLKTHATSSQSSQTPRSSNVPGRRIVLLEDLPNVLHPDTQARFHVILRGLVDGPPVDQPVPVVIIISDAQTRGEDSDEFIAYSRTRNGQGDGVINIRTVFPRDLLNGPYVTEIAFNPIAPTLLRRALQALLDAHFSSNKNARPSKEVLEIVVESANGDIRSAIMALQFACTIEIPEVGVRKKKRDANMSALMLESVTRREQSLVLFHLLGKVLYNKRKGDPPSSSLSAKDVQKEKLLDSLMKNPPKPPPWLKEHDRKASRVDVDMLYANSPIDSDLFSLYLHQNYTQFVTDMNECDGIADCLSWVDSSGGDAWYQANPYRFHLLTLGTLHSLPSPVPRQNQKLLKPQYFEYLVKEKEAWRSVQDVQSWMARNAANKHNSIRRVCEWSQREIALELGGVLKAFDACRQKARSPSSHQRFSRMTFNDESTSSQLQWLREEDLDVSEVEMGSNDQQESRDDNVSGGWLEGDDIEEF